MSADPTRLDLLEELRLEGPFTTQELGRRVPGARGGMQLHLLALVEGEWIERISGDGRQTLWAARPGGVEWSESDEDNPDVALAIEDLYWITLQRRIGRLKLWDAARQTGQWSKEWVNSAIGRDYTLVLSPAQLDALDEELAAVFERYRDLSLAARDEPAGGESEKVFLTVSGFPLTAER